MVHLSVYFALRLGGKCTVALGSYDDNDSRSDLKNNSTKDRERDDIDGCYFDRRRAERSLHRWSSVFFVSSSTTLFSIFGQRTLERAIRSLISDCQNRIDMCCCLFHHQKRLDRAVQLKDRSSRKDSMRNSLPQPWSAQLCQTNRSSMLVNVFIFPKNNTDLPIS